MTGIPAFIRELRARIGHDELWLTGSTAVVRRGSEVLLVRRADNAEWSPVTGIVDPGEHPARTAVREAFEEAGVHVRVDGLATIGVGDPIVHANGDRARYLDHTFACTWLSGDAHVADEESTEVGWFALTDLPPMRTELVDRIRAAVDGPLAAWIDGGA